MKRPPPPAPRAPRRNLAVLSACQSANRFTSSQDEALVHAFRVMRPTTNPHPEERSPERVSKGEGLSAGWSYSKASSHVPRVAALEYSVARFSKKLVCSTPLRMASSQRSEEHTSDLKSLMRSSYAVFV